MTTTAYRYGWKPDLPDHRDMVREPEPELLANLPAKVDWRDDPAMPPVYDQQQIGSCTGNGNAGAFEFCLRLQDLLDFTPSRLFIYYNERALEHSVGTDSGAQIRDGIKTLAKQGVVPETEWPYDGDPANEDGSWPAGHRAGMKPPANLYAEATHNESIGYARVVQDAAHMKAALAAKQLIVFGFSVYESFESQQVAQTGVAPMPKPSEQMLGGHCTVIVGYDDALGVWICRNSWGTGWGQAGYFTMPYAYMTNRQLSSDFWTIKRVS